MLIAARTASKSAGIGDILTIIVYGKEKDAIAVKMEEMAEERKIEDFRRDTKNARESEAVISIGVRGFMERRDSQIIVGLVAWLCFCVHP
jgi:uncharacterized ferredoxin-like protein